MALTLKSVNPSASNAGTEATIAGARLFDKAMQRVTSGVKGALDSNVAVQKDASANLTQQVLAGFDASTEDDLPAIKQQVADLLKNDTTLTTEDKASILTKANNASNELFDRGQTAFTQGEQADKNLVSAAKTDEAVADVKTQEDFDNFQGLVANAGNDRDLNQIVKDAQASGLPQDRITAITQQADARKAANLATRRTGVQAREEFAQDAQTRAIRQITNTGDLQPQTDDTGLQTMFKVEDIVLEVQNNPDIFDKKAGTQKALSDLGYTPEILFASIEEDIRNNGETPTVSAIQKRAKERNIPLTGVQTLSENATRDKVTGNDVVKARIEEQRQIRLQDAAKKREFENDFRNKPAFRKEQLDSIIPENSNLFNQDDRPRAMQAVTAMLKAIPEEDMSSDDLIGLLAEFGQSGKFWGGAFNENEFFKVAKTQGNINKLTRELANATTDTEARNASQQLQAAKQKFNTDVSGKSSFDPRFTR